MAYNAFRPYETRGGNAKFNAQANLKDRTHYVDDDSLRFHKARILSAHPEHDGLLYAITESVALDYEGTRRGYRYVVFDLFGNVVSRVDLEHCDYTSRQAYASLQRFLNQVDAKAVTLEALGSEERHFANMASELRAKLGEGA